MPDETYANDDQKRTILDAATKVFAEKGYAKASVREIAKMAGATTGAIYYYYKDKSDLLVDVVRDHIHYVHALYRTDETGADKSASSLLKDVTDATEKRLRNDEWQRLHLMLVSEIVSSDEHTRQEHRDAYAMTIERTADLFAPALEVPDDRRKRLVASILVAALDGMAIQTSLGVHDDEMDDLVATFNDFFVKSISTYLDGSED